MNNRDLDFQKKLIASCQKSVELEQSIKETEKDPAFIAIEKVMGLKFIEQKALDLEIALKGPESESSSSKLRLPKFKR